MLHGRGEGRVVPGAVCIAGSLYRRETRIGGRLLTVVD